MFQLRKKINRSFSSCAAFFSCWIAFNSMNSAHAIMDLTFTTGTPACMVPITQYIQSAHFERLCLKAVGVAADIRNAVAAAAAADAACLATAAVAGPAIVCCCGAAVMAGAVVTIQAIDDDFTLDKVGKYMNAAKGSSYHFD